jgi:hypothetical protein
MADFQEETTMTICMRAVWYGLRWATHISAVGDLATAIRASESPPAKISEDSAHPQCQSCEHRTVCHGSTLPLPTCRSCAHVTPMMDGWHCEKWKDRIPLEAQRTGCDQHLYHPEIVPFLRPIAGDMKANWIKFQSADGETWINGVTQPGAITSAAAYAAQQTAHDAPNPHVSAMSELSIDSGIPIQNLVSGALTEQEWANVTTGVERYYDRWKDQPEKMARLRSLMEYLDSQFCAIVEKARAAL